MLAGAGASVTVDEMAATPVETDAQAAQAPEANDQQNANDSAPADEKAEEAAQGATDQAAV